MTPPTITKYNLQVLGEAQPICGLVLPENTTVEVWASIGRSLYWSAQDFQWQLGDWAVFGCKKYGKLKEFAEANGINYQTLRNIAWVAENVELSRRRDTLEWSTHAEVAALKPEEQAEWLDKAEKERLPRAELRKQIRQSRGEQNALESDGPSVPFPSKLCDELVTFLKGQSPDFWEPEIKAIWRDRLRPIAEFYGTL